MENPIYIGLSRQTALRREMSVVANNIANMNTSGFRKEMMINQAYIERQHIGSKLDFVIDKGTAIDFTPGKLDVTGNTFDLAVDGPGYFQVDDGQGIKYTRNGTFFLDDQNRLVSQPGHPVVDPNGNPIVIPSGGASIEIAPDGTVFDGEEVVGRIGIVEFDENYKLRKEKDSLYVTDETPKAALNSRVMQGMIERSNVDPIYEMTNMIEVHRSYDAVKKMIDKETERQQNVVRRLARPMQVQG